MKTKQLLYLSSLSIVLFSLLLSACGGSSKGKELTASNYKLEIVDSIQIDLMSQGLNIMDVHKRTGEILAIQSSPPIAYILDKEGKILKKMDKPGESPEGVGKYILSAEFYEEGVALMGVMRVKIYDSDFNLKISTKADYNQSGMIYLGRNHLYELEGSDHSRLVSFFGPQTEHTSSQKEYYPEFNVVDLLDPYLAQKETLIEEISTSDIYKPIGKLAPDSRYLTSGKAFYFMKPVFDVKGSSMYYAFDDDTTLYELALPAGDIVNEISIPFDDFILFEGYSMGKAGFDEQMQPRDWAGKITNVFHVDGFDVVVYTSGIKRAKILELDPESSDFREKTKRVNYVKYLVLKDGERLNVDLRIPEKVSSFDMADDDGYIWGHQNLSLLDEEPDLITFYKLKAVTDQ